MTNRIITATMFGGLATGLNRWNGQRWVESNPALIVTNGVILGFGAQHSVVFPPNLTSTNGANPIQIKDSVGNCIKVKPLCLAYHDVLTGSNRYFAVLKSSTAVIVGTNRVVYPDAWDGATASISYNFSRFGISQDVRFQARPPTPESLGLNSKSSHLLVISELTQCPDPQIQDRSFPGMGNMRDQTIKVGAMTMIPGRAFLASKSNRLSGISVTKTYFVSNGRQLVADSAFALTLFSSRACRAKAQRRRDLPRRSLGERGLQTKSKKSSFLSPKRQLLWTYSL